MDFYKLLFVCFLSTLFAHFARLKRKIIIYPRNSYNLRNILVSYPLWEEIQLKTQISSYFNFSLEEKFIYLPMRVVPGYLLFFILIILKPFFLEIRELGNYPLLSAGSSSHTIVGSEPPQPLYLLLIIFRAHLNCKPPEKI